MYSVFRFSLVFLIIFLLSSCGLTYISNSNNIKNSLITNHNYSFNDCLNSKINYLLCNQNAGLFYFLKNQNTQSINYFNNALVYYKELEEKNKFSLSKILSFSVLSDNFINYEGSNYEQALIRYYNGLNYMLIKNLDSAYIEFRAAEETQKFAEEINLKKIINSETEINKFLSDNKLRSEDINKILKDSANLRANTRNKFINGNILYVAGIVKETSKSYNDALVNYKQAYSVEPNNLYLLQDLYRLSLIYDPSYAKLLKIKNPILKKYSPNNYSAKNTVYLIYEKGFVQEKENIKIPLILPNGLLLTLNLPAYSAEITNKSSNNVSLIVPNTGYAPAYEVTNINNLAKNQLLENYPIIIARQLGKLATQITTLSALQNKNNDSTLGVVFGSLYLFDSSDIRSWSTLPNYIKIAKISTVNNVNYIIASLNNKEYNVPLKLSGSQLAIVYIFDSGEQVYTKLLYSGNK